MKLTKKQVIDILQIFFRFHHQDIHEELAAINEKLDLLSKELKESKVVK